MTNLKRTETERMMQECRTNWFKDHVAKIITQNEHVTVINWRNPSSWNYGCRILIHAGWVTVVGDIGEAVYQWGQTVDFPFLSKIAFDYFKGKCQSSEGGKKFESWDGRIATELVKEWIKDQEGLDEHDRPSDYEKIVPILQGIYKEMPEDEYDQAMREIYDETGDSEWASIFSGFGVVPNVRCVGHFVAMQMAIAQLNGAAETQKFLAETGARG